MEASSLNRRASGESRQLEVVRPRCEFWQMVGLHLPKNSISGTENEWKTIHYSALMEGVATRHVSDGVPKW